MIQFNINHLFALILNIKLFYLIQSGSTLSGATTLGQSRPGSDGNEGVHLEKSMNPFVLPQPIGR